MANYKEAKYLATPSVPGTISPADKAKLDSVAANATALAIGTTTGTAGDGGILNTAVSKLAGIAAGATNNTLAVGTATGTAYDGALGVAAAGLAAAAVPNSQVLIVSADINLITASNDVVTAYTLPASPTGAGRWILRRALGRVKTVPTGTGTPSNAFRLGRTSGEQEILLDFTVDSTATIGLISAGQALLSLGADMIAANGFEAVYAAGQAFYLKRTKGGTTVTGGTVTVNLYFEAIQ